MATSPIAETQTLAAFEEENSAAGRLRRYARGRVRHYPARQIATVAGGLALGLLVSPVVGTSAAAIALLGEAVDCEVLRRVPDALRTGATPERLRILTSATAGLQALTISGCVLTAQFTAIGGEASLFAFSFLAAAVLNAGVVMSHQPSAARVRIVIYAVTALIGMAAELTVEETPEGLIYDLFGLSMMAFISYVFIRFVHGAHRRRTEDSRRLLEGQEALERANRDLRQREAEVRQLALVARHTNDSIVLFDPGGRILWVNEGFTRMSGHAPEDAIGRTAELWRGPDTDPAVAEAIADAVRAGRSHRAEVVNYARSGQKIWVDSEVVPIMSASGALECIVATERDMTETRKRAVELALAKERAEEGARAKAAFLATMSHEIRTPMNGIIGMADLLADGPLAQEQRLYADTIRNSAEALLKIINDILEYSKLEADKMPIVEEPFSLSSCIRDAVEILRPQAREKHLYLDLCHHDPLPEAVTGDSGRLRQILINLLGNGIKFTDAGGVTLTTRVRPSSEGFRLTVQVQDTGIGVPGDRAEKVFDQFEQADAETTRKYGGTGLGLAISRELARRMGGDLVIVEGNGKGACFELRLVLSKARPEMAETVASPQGGAPRPLAPMRLLLAEDNATNRLLVQRFLRGQPITLTEAKNGREAVDMTRLSPPDVILMDMSMPVLDGLEATREIRALDLPQPRIIALTANAFLGDREDCIGAGMDDFLSKPLRKSELLAALSRSQEPRDKPLCPPPRDAVSQGAPAVNEAPHWTSPPESGTTSGRSIRSSAR